MRNCVSNIFWGSRPSWYYLSSPGTPILWPIQWTIHTCILQVWPAPLHSKTLQLVIISWSKRHFFVHISKYEIWLKVLKSYTTGSPGNGCKLRRGETMAEGEEAPLPLSFILPPQFPVCPTICPWVSKDETRQRTKLCLLWTQMEIILFQPFHQFSSIFWDPYVVNTPLILTDWMLSIGASYPIPKTMPVELSQ